MKTTTAENEPQTEAKLHDLIRDIAVAMVVTVSPEGVLRSRPMLTREPDTEGQLCFFTSSESEMSDDIAEEHAVNVVYADPSRDRYVSVSGRAEFEQDRGQMEKLWDPALKRYFAQGLDDSRLALLRVRIEYAEFWDGMGTKVPLVGSKHGSRSDDGSAAVARTRDAGTAHRDPEAEHTQIDIRATPTSG